MTPEDQQVLSSSTPTSPDQQVDVSTPAADASGMSRRSLLKGAAASATTLAALGGLALPTNVVAASLPKVTSTSPIVEFPRAGQLREYWFQADSFFHNLVPTGVDGMTGATFTPNQTSYWAVGYRAFTPNWGKPLPGNDDIGPNTGIPGPIIRCQVGDTIRVHFRNNDTYYKVPHSVSVHALAYTPENDGGWAWMLRDRPGTAINVGDTYTYEWKAIPRSVGTWPYHDHSVPSDPGRGLMVMEAGAELGLFGMIVVTDENTPTVDKEFSVIWHSLYSGDVPGLSQDFHCFNGFAYLGNTPNFRAKVGQHVRWRVVSLGNDFHTFHIHAHTWLYNGNYEDTIVIGPGSKLTLDFIEDNPGTWYYHCHVPIHVMGPGMGGMLGFYIVDK
jgi:FtsP/CotA-like multicopper oxidase with cupredoxin domain